MNESERFVILAAVDDGELSMRVAMVATNLARTYAGAELHFMTAVKGPPRDDATALLEAARERLDLLARHATRDWRGRTIAHVAIGEPGREILQMAARLHADMIVCSTHGRTGLKHVLLGSIAERLVRDASCPVLVVREKDYYGDLATEIEPPCPDCLQTQAQTKGAQLWCARHSQHHPRAHLHYEYPQGFGAGSSLIQDR